MPEIDLVIAAFIAVLAVLGFFQGFIVGVMSMAGLAIGAVLGTRIAAQVLAGGAESPYTSLVGLLFALGFAVLMSASMQDIGVWLRRTLLVREGVALDRVLGAALSAVLGLGFVWLAASVLMTVPQLREARPHIVRSQVIGQLNTLLPPSGPILNALAQHDPFPAFQGPRINVAEPPAQVPRDPEVRAAAASVVRVVGSACGFGVTGSGWVAAEGVVVTNAHVVAGQLETGVQVNGRGHRHEATVMHFDSRNDIAVLSVPSLELPPLRFSAATKSGEPGATLGYPENGPFTARAARLGATQKVRSQDVYGKGPVLRDVTSFRGRVQHGNSGGPVVDGEGRVMTTVFASTVGNGPQGGYGVPNAIVQQALRSMSAPVSTGPCLA